MSCLTFAVPLLLALALAPPPAASLSPEAQHAYEAAKAQAGVDPAKLVALALWCEARGLGQEKKSLLQRAAKLDPKSPLAHGLLGLVRDKDQWVTPEAVAARVKADETLTAKLAEYNARRAQINREADAERLLVANLEKQGLVPRARLRKHQLDRQLAPQYVKLGLWCEQNGLKPEALANFTTALHFNPYNEATWRHLGYVKHNGRWMSHEQIAAEAREVLAQKHADRHWEPLLRKWASELKQKKRSDQAEAQLAKVNDPRAVPSIIRVFVDAAPEHQRDAVRLLGQIDSPESTKELATLAVFSESPDVRQAAAQTLKERPLRDYGERLVSLIHAPVTYQFQPVTGVGSQGALVLDSPRFHLVRTYQAPAPFRLGSNFHGYVGYDANGLPVVINGNDLRRLNHHLHADLSRHDGGARYESDLAGATRQAEERAAELLAAANFKAAIARERLATDVRDVELSNAQARELNSRSELALMTALDAPRELGADDEDAWRSWYYERIGYRYTPPPKVTLSANATLDLPAPLIVSCFAAGTPVRTREGTGPIESLRAGDQVLAQDVTTGGLSFEPILVVHHNPPDRTLRITTDHGDTVVASRFHRFWRAGRGWAMARDLKPGDVLRTLDGLARISAIEDAPIQPVFNLDVADSRTYFVGGSAMLVHDNTLPPTNPTAPPFDRTATLAALEK